MLQTETLSEASVKRICSSLQLKMGKDPALSAAEKLHLRQQIGHPPKVGGPAHHTVAQMANALNTDYLRRWAGIAGKGEHTVEMFARSVASHVLDAGFSAQHVRQLLKAKASGPDPITLAEICEELHGMQTSNPTIAEAFHRLYRQRNLVLHGGRLDSVTLKASLRTVSKLAGAGMDRITHGHYVQSVRPLELVARANLSIALISKERALDCVDLLE